MGKTFFNVINNLFRVYNLINSKLTIESGVFQGITIALITILIPLFIAQLNSDSDFGKFDIWVVFDYILGFKKFIFITVSSFLLTILWSIPSLNPVKLFILVLWILCNFLIIRRLLNFYLWIKGEKNEHRLSYLKIVAKERDIEFAFSSIWEGKNINFVWEKQFFEVFKTKVDYLIHEKKYSIVSSLLSNFKNNLANITDFGILRYLEHILVWYYRLFLISDGMAKGNDRSLFDIEETIFTLKTTIMNAEKRALEKGLSKRFFSQLERSVNNFYEENKIIESLFNYKGIAETLFEDANKFEVFDGFPRNWTITPETIKGSNNKIAFIWFVIFFKWIHIRLYEHIEESFDEQTEIIVQSLFPEADTNVLSNFFILLFSYGKDHPMEWAVKTKWGFGKISSPKAAFRSYTGDLNKDWQLAVREIEERKNETFVFIANLIKARWVPMQPTSLDSLSKNSKELKSLNFSKQSPEEYSQKEYLELIKRVIEELEKSN